MKSQINVEKSYVLNAELPNHGDSYTVISHKYVIDTTKQMLESTDPDLGMMFAWTNSYDKSIRFQCAIGAYVMACSNGMVCGELNYARKHTGSADQEIRSQISNQIKNAQKAFNTIKNDKDSLRGTPLDVKKQAELLGIMYFNEDLISPRQMSVVKDEMKNPSFDYNADMENAWAFYNHVTHSYKSVHPRSWLSDSKKFHDFMMANVLKGAGSVSYDTINTQASVEMEDVNHDQEVTYEEAQEYIAGQMAIDQQDAREAAANGPNNSIEEHFEEELDEDFDFEI